MTIGFGATDHVDAFGRELIGGRARRRWAPSPVGRETQSVDLDGQKVSQLQELRGPVLPGQHGGARVCPMRKEDHEGPKVAAGRALDWVARVT